MAIHNKLIIITAPSGAGKTSITHHLMRTFPQLAFSISAATRQARGIEKSGVDYYFMDMADFKQKIQHNEFVEWEMVYEGKYYGTLKSELQSPMLGRAVALKIIAALGLTPERPKQILASAAITPGFVSGK